MSSPAATLTAGQVEAEPGVVAVRLADDPHSLHPLAQRRAPPHHRGPVHVPRVVGLASQEPAQRLGLLGFDVPLAGLQPEGGVLEAGHEVGERLGQ